MRSKQPDKPVEDDLFRQELANIINRRHELVRLAELIDWSVFDREFGAQFVSTTGRPALPTRLVAGLLYLKHVYALSDEDIVERWVENPYFQYFCGERYFRHELPCDPSSLVRWRKRIGKAGAQVAADADESRIRNLARKPINLPPLFRTPSHITPWIRGFDSTGGHDASLPMPQDYRRGPPRSYCITLPWR